MESVEVLAQGQAANVEEIKARREAFIKEYAATLRGLRANGQLTCGMGPNKDYGCNTCGAVFITASVDAKCCPACGGSELRVLSTDEFIAGLMSWRIGELIEAEDKAEIKELYSQKLGKRAIAERLGIRIGRVSEVVGIKRKPLQQGTIDYIRNEYLSGRSEWDIKEDLGRISEKRVHDAITDLCQEIRKTCNQGTRLEDIGEVIGIHGHDEAIIEIANRFIKLDASLREGGCWWMK